MSPSNEQEIADIRRTLAMLAERVVRLERKVMGRTLVEVFAEDERFPSQLSVLPYEDDHENDGVSCSGLLERCLCPKCSAWRVGHG